MNLESIYYNSNTDLELLIETEGQTLEKFSAMTGIARNTLYSIKKGNAVTDKVLEKLYSYAYENNYRLNSVKEDLLKETCSDKVLFHGSKRGLRDISTEGSRKNCDFGNGFYLGETYSQALSFVCENRNSSVYSFVCDLKGLNIVKFDCSLDWMLAVCYYRGTINEFADSKIIRDIVMKVESADVVVAPIADNKMFYIMSLFAQGELNADASLHSLAASKLGLQYIFKTDRALATLKPVERYYLCENEKADCRQRLVQRGSEIDTKLKLSKREYRDGLYIEELLK